MFWCLWQHSLMHEASLSRDSVKQKQVFLCVRCSKICKCQTKNLTLQRKEFESHGDSPDQGGSCDRFEIIDVSFFVNKATLGSSGKQNMNMDKNIENRDNENLLQHREEFETVYGIISAHKKRAMNAMHNESLNMLWEVGAYVSDRLKELPGVMALCVCWQSIFTPGVPRLRVGAIAQSIRWYSSMRPIHRRVSTR